MIKSQFALLLLLLIFTSCSVKRKAANVNKVLKNPTPEGIINYLIANHLSPEGMTAKASVRFEDEYLRVSGSLTIKVRKDSIIWLSIKKLGFEAARVQITNDSIQILNRLDNEYYAYPLSYINKEYNLPADFGVIEDIFYGNPLFLGDQTYNLNVRDTCCYKMSNPSEKAFLTKLSLDRSKLQVKEAHYYDQLRKDRFIQLAFDNYGAVDNKENFAYFRTLNFANDETGWVNLQIDFSKVSFQKPNSIRFDIPDKYTRK